MSDPIDLNAERDRRAKAKAAQEPSVYFGSLTTDTLVVEAYCSGIIHFFPNPPGRCQCGEREWDGIA